MQGFQKLNLLEFLILSEFQLVDGDSITRKEAHG